MTEILASPSKVVTSEEFSSASIEKLILYMGIPTGTILFIVDPMEFPDRDSAISGFQMIRDIKVLNKIVPNPNSVDIDSMAAEARQIRPTAVVAIGGGSTLDSAKAVNMLISNEGSLDEYLGPNPDRTITRKDCPLILIPTTAGTGSEVTRFGVYTSGSGRKYTLASEFLRADTALLSKALIKDLPPKLVAVAGYDALTHALETLWNKNATALSDVLAEEAVIAVLSHLKPAWDEAEAGLISEVSGDERFKLLQAANIAGIAFDKTGTAAIHALSFILSEEWHLSHGEACAFFTDTVFDTNSSQAPVADKLFSIARKLNIAENSDTVIAGVSKLGEYLKELRADMGLVSEFDQLKGFASPKSAEEKDKLLHRFDSALTDPKMGNNIVPIDTEQLKLLVAPKIT